MQVGSRTFPSVLELVGGSTQLLRQGILERHYIVPFVAGHMGIQPGSQHILARVRSSTVAGPLELVE